MNECVLIRVSSGYLGARSGDCIVYVEVLRPSRPKVGLWISKCAEYGDKEL